MAAMVDRRTQSRESELCWTSDDTQEIAISLGNLTIATLGAAASVAAVKGCSGKTNGTEYARP